MKSYKIALMGGTHQHRWNAGTCEKCGKQHTPHQWGYNSGVCSVCGYGCLHPDGWNPYSTTRHVCDVCQLTTDHDHSVIAGTRESCFHCNTCGADISPHTFANGLCSVCNYSCDHAGTFQSYSKAEHRCSFCAMRQAHNFHTNANADACKTCSTCGYVLAHEFQGAHCPVCNFTCSHTAKHSQHGICPVCGVQVCTHEDTATNSYGDVICNTCGAQIKRYYDTFYTKVLPYMAMFEFGGTLNDQKYYNGYREEANYSSSGIKQGSTWWECGIYLFALNITTPTRYGGDYMYTCQGLVFTTSPSSLPVNPDLLKGDGKYIKSLKQYNLDGTLKASGDYTSSDFPALYDITRDALIIA